MTSEPYQVDAKTISDFQRDGAVCIRGAFKDWVETIAAGIERNMRDKSAAGSDIEADGGRDPAPAARRDASDIWVFL